MPKTVKNIPEKKVIERIGNGIFKGCAEVDEFHKGIKKNVKREYKRQKRKSGGGKENGYKSYYNVSDAAEHGQSLMSCVGTDKAVDTVCNDKDTAQPCGRLYHYFSVYKYKYTDSDKSCAVQEQPRYIEVLFYIRLYGHNMLLLLEIRQ